VGDDVLEDPLRRIAHYVDHRASHSPVLRCAACGRELEDRRGRYCSEACRKMAYRRRRQERTKHES
jgi:hypothetical protein